MRSRSQCEQLLAAPVLEIYGSTETGALAMRRTARETRWPPLDGVRLDPATARRSAGARTSRRRCSCSTSSCRARTARFTLLGRQADLVKIAGRRASLAGLNLLLQDLPGLEDGVFYLPATGNPTERLCLIHSGPAARSGGDAPLAARAARSGVPAARLHPRSIGCRATTTASCAGRRSTALFADWQSAAAAARRRRSAADRAGEARGRRDATVDQAASWHERTQVLAMTSWKAKAERGSAWLIHLIAWLARAAGRPLCRALLFPIVAYFVVTDGTARRASREFLARATGRPAGWADVFAHLYCFAATLLDRVCMAQRRFPSLRRHASTATRWSRDALASGKGCVLLGSHLGSFDLMTLKNKVLHDRPVTLLMHIDERARVRRIAGIDDSKLSIIPLGRFDSYLRAYEVLERGGLVVALADRAENAAALQRRLLRPAGALPDRPACARGARRRDRPDGLRPVRGRRALPDRVRRVRPGRRPPAAAARRCSR